MEDAGRKTIERGRPSFALRLPSNARMMSNIALREITRENWRAALSLAVRPEQQRFIADYAPIAAIALAKAYIRPDGLVWLPYAIYAAEQMIGLIELAYEPGSRDQYW